MAKLVKLPSADAVKLEYILQLRKAALIAFPDSPIAKSEYDEAFKRFKEVFLNDQRD